jgi:hypothetical protein
MAQLTYWEGQPGRTPIYGGGPSWTGWVGFAGVMMILIGAFNAFEGLVALFKDDFFVSDRRGFVLFNYMTWGWIWIILAIVVFLAGIAVMSGRRWGIVVGVILATSNAVGHLTFLPAFPIWSLMIIVLDVTVIYALVAHGSERAQSM